MRGKALLRSILWRYGIAVTRTETYKRLLSYEEDARDVALLQALRGDLLAAYMGCRKDSTAQLRQDLFALGVAEFKRDGFFVEFGAADGVHLSNTFLCEARFGWRGILAEPARRWHAKLRQHRNAIIDTRCVWTVSGSKMSFTETENAELSTLTSFSQSDAHGAARLRAQRYEVETVSLNDLLAQHGAPTFVDYLSIDTEGSEYDILMRLDFSRYSFGAITCEHNNTSSRSLIHDLLRAKGYRRVLADVSSFDDWYVPEHSPFLRGSAHSQSR